MRDPVNTYMNYLVPMVVEQTKLLHFSGAFAAWRSLAPN